MLRQMGAPPTDLMIAQTLPCIRCGYDLRTIRLSQVCPECGAAAAESLDHLVLSPDRHLRRLRWGAVMAGYASVNLPVVYFFTVFFALVLAAPVGSRSWLDQLLILTVAAAVLVGPVLGLIGWSRLRFAQPPVPLGDGDEHRPPHRATVGLVLPLSIIFLILATIAVTTLWGSALRRGRTWLNDEATMWTVLGLLGSVWAVRMHLGMRHLGDLFGRIGRRRARASSRFWGWFAIALIPVYAAGVGLAYVVPRVRLPIDSLDSDDVGMILVALTAAGTAGVCIANFALCGMFAGSIRRVRRMRRGRTEPMFTSIAADSAAPPSSVAAPVAAGEEASP